MVRSSDKIEALFASHKRESAPGKAHGASPISKSSKSEGHRTTLPTTATGTNAKDTKGRISDTKGRDQPPRSKRSSLSLSQDSDPRRPCKPHDGAVFMPACARRSRSRSDPHANAKAEVDNQRSVPSTDASVSPSKKSKRRNRDRSAACALATEMRGGCGKAAIRRQTKDGWNLYTEAELQTSASGGDTALCPFDCECCF